jgi:hypothetical protein
MSIVNQYFNEGAFTSKLVQVNKETGFYNYLSAFDDTTFVDKASDKTLGSAFIFDYSETSTSKSYNIVNLVDMVTPYTPAYFYPFMYSALLRDSTGKKLNLKLEEKNFPLSQ